MRGGSLTRTHRISLAALGGLALASCQGAPGGLDGADDHDAVAEDASVPDATAPAAADAMVDAGFECSFPQGVPDEDFTPCAMSYTDTDPVVDAAVNAVMAELTGCSVGSDCSLTALAGATAEEKCQSWFAIVTATLRERGFCVGLHVVGSTDEIAASNTGCTGRWYGYHVCNYGGPKVVWNPGARRGWCQITPSWCP